MDCRNHVWLLGVTLIYTPPLHADNDTVQSPASQPAFTRPSPSEVTAAEGWLTHAELHLAEVEAKGHRDELIAGIARIKLREGDLRGARWTVERIEDPQKRGAEYDLMAKWAESQSMEADAKEFREKAKKLDPLLREIEARIMDPSRHAECDKAVELAAKGEFENAMSIIEGMTAHLRPYPYLQVAEALAKGGMYEQARQAALRIPAGKTYWGTNVQSNALSLVADAQYKRGDLDAARETILMISAPISRLTSYAAIAQDQASKGSIEAALETMKDVESAGRLVEPPVSSGRLGDMNASAVRWVTVEPYLDIARAQWKAGDKAAARAGLERLVEAVKNLHSDAESSREFLIRQCMSRDTSREECEEKVGMLDEETVSRLESLFSMMWLRRAVASVVELQCEMGDLEGSLRTANATSDCAARMHAYAVMAALTERDDIIDELAAIAIACDGWNASYATVAEFLDRHGRTEAAERIVTDPRKLDREQPDDPRSIHQDLSYLAGDRACRWSREKMVEWIDTLDTPEQRAHACIGAAGAQFGCEPDDPKMFIRLFALRK